MLIGRGRDRACYFHPLDQNKCIKVSIVDNDKQSRREPSYYKKLQADNISWDAISKYHGKVDTNLGDGLVFDIVQDFDGATSKAISYYLDHNLIDQEILTEILLNIKNYLFTNNVLTRDISPNNLLFKRSSEKIGKLIIIDGLGNAELLPISSYFNYFTQRKINRKWRSLINKMQLEYPDYTFNKL